MDLDLIFDETKENSRVIVAHPMEFKKESEHYSPCSLLPLEKVIGLLDDVYHDQNWFVSLELKGKIYQTSVGT